MPCSEEVSAVMSCGSHDDESVVRSPPCHSGLDPVESFQPEIPPPQPAPAATHTSHHASHHQPRGSSSSSSSSSGSSGDGSSGDGSSSSGDGSSGDGSSGDGSSSSGDGSSSSGDGSSGDGSSGDGSSSVGAVASLGPYLPLLVVLCRAGRPKRRADPRGPAHRRAAAATCAILRGGTSPDHLESAPVLGLDRARAVCTARYVARCAQPRRRV
jgi:hypothetical protein